MIRKRYSLFRRHENGKNWVRVTNSSYWLADARVYYQDALIAGVLSKNASGQIVRTPLSLRPVND